MTKQEAAALLRAGPVTFDGVICLTDTERLTIADLLDPPREGLAKVQIALAWDDRGEWMTLGFGHHCRYGGTAEFAFVNLAEHMECALAPTIITAYVPRPARTVAQVEGEVEG